MERFILATTNEGDMILDPFYGNPTTGVAAIKTKCRFVGIELEPEFLDVSVKRLEQAIDIKKSSLDLE